MQVAARIQDGEGELDLASEQLVHRRVAAVLTFLRDASLRSPG